MNSKRRPEPATEPAAPDASPDALRRLVQLLALQAAREAFAEDQAAAWDDVEPEDEP